LPLPAFAATAATTPAIATAAAAESTAATSGPASATAATTGPAATAAEPSLVARAGFIHGQRPTVQIGPVQGVDRRSRLGVIRHFDECEPARLAGVPVADDLDAIDLSVLSEYLLEVLFDRRVRKITNVNTLH
jgi:hypothetical protein